MAENHAESLAPTENINCPQPETLKFSDEEYDKLVDELKISALEFANTHGAKDWLINGIREKRELDAIVSEMRHLEGGQIFILEKLHELKPDLEWYRGGTIATWRDQLGHSNYYTQEQLDTLVIDGGANGVLGRPEIAINFLKRAYRAEPVFYTLSLESLIEGLKSDAIYLVSEHNYDLRVVYGKNRLAYLEFCRKYLNINKAD